MQFKGVVKKFGDTINGRGEKGEWSKTSVLVEEIDTQYPNSFVFEAFNKPLDGLAVGMIVNVDYNGKASEYNGKLYNSLLIWKIESVGATKPAQSTGIVNLPNPIDEMPEDDGNLPF